MAMGCEGRGEHGHLGEGVERGADLLVTARLRVTRASARRGERNKGKRREREARGSGATRFFHGTSAQNASP